MVENWIKDLTVNEAEITKIQAAENVLRGPTVSLPQSPDPTPILKYFAYAHLPEKLQAVSRPVGELAALMDATLPNGPEKTVGLRKLLEAKDAFVRSLV